ncbi:hypothetical protein Glove_345g60 [Diversispora epigaea]|uniref:HMG box domain-containing protein n=1 Tax=Diversispora epigaea TaxID=1348612 RepID=A0A397HFH3_9GLOM|nr:hypothetical protein Glove_345g60 [Diversispora epigaea]
MNIEIRNKYCGLLMFNTFPAKNSSSEFVMDSSYSSFEQPESYYYKSQTDSQETSIAAGAADVTKDNNNNNNNNNNNKNNNNKSSAKSKTTEKSPPRPPNAFILYRREKQPAILATHRHLSNAEISRYIASLWRNETNEIRLKWERFADQTKLEHMKAYPNYVYRPNKNKEKSEKKRNKQTTSTSTVPTYVSNTSATTSSVPSIIVDSPSSNIFATNHIDTIGPIRVSTRGQHRVNIIDRPQQLNTTSYTSMLSSPTDITSFYDPLMSFGYTDIPSATSTASSISSISSSPEHQQQMNQISQMNQMNQINQINQINQMNQMNHFQDTLDDLWRIIPTQSDEISQQQQQLSGPDFSFQSIHPMTELTSSPTTTASPSSTTIPTTIPVSIPSPTNSHNSYHENTIVDPSIVYCNSSNNDNSFYNQQSTLPSEFDNYFGIFNC